MADVHDKATRSYNMSRIRGADTRPEMLVRKYLHGRGLRYRVHGRNLPGKPDIVLPKYRTVIFVNGCFWHGHEGCKYFVMPKTRTEWWKSKIGETINRDKQARNDLEKLGWITIVVWECELRPEKQGNTLRELIDVIKY
jgi:DNA mismatch endonuclease, patch repair protein